MGGESLSLPSLPEHCRPEGTSGFSWYHQVEGSLFLATTSFIFLRGKEIYGRRKAGSPVPGSLCEFIPEPPSNVCQKPLSKPWRRGSTCEVSAFAACVGGQLVFSNTEAKGRLQLDLGPCVSMLACFTIA